MIENTTLINLAAKARPATKVAAKAALKSVGFKQTLADELLAIVAKLTNLRAAAPAARITRKLGCCPVNPSLTSIPYAIIYNRIARVSDERKPVYLRAGTLASRLHDLRTSAVLASYRCTYREAAHGSFAAVLTTNPAAVGIRQTETLDWDLYRGTYKGRPARVQDTVVTVPCDWRVRVERRGLAVVDGMMTLDASILEASGCELFAAIWAVQGRGTSVTTTRGYIARSGSVTYHGATIEQAMNGITRKSRALAVTALLASVDMRELVAKSPNLLVSVTDARLIGACEYGIKSWCNAVDLDYKAGSAPLGDVYAAYQREPRAEARAAILHTLRRARKLVTS